MRFLRYCACLLFWGHRYVIMGAALTIGWSASSFAQDDTDYVIRHFTNEDGLPQNSVIDINLDPNGFLWIVTQGGISRYDGNHFRLYNSATSSLPTDRVNWLSVSRNGNIYIRLSHHPNIFYRFTKNYNLVYDSLLSSKPYVLLGKRSEPVIIDTGIYGNSNRQKNKELTLRLPTILDEKTIALNEHQLYYLYHKQLEFFDNRTGVIQPCGVRLDTIAHAVFVKDLLLISDKTKNWQALRAGKRLTDIPATPAFLKLLAAIKADDDSGTHFFRNNYAGTLLYYKGNVWQIKLENGLLDARLIFTGIHFFQIGYLLYDERSSTLFVGTVVDGLYIVNKKKFHTISFDKADMEGNNVYAQIQVDTHTVVNRYYSYDPLRNGYSPLKRPLPQTAFYKTADGRIWHSTGTHIVGCDAAFANCTQVAFRDTSMNNVVGCFAEDEERRLWFSLDHSVGYIQKDQPPVFSFYNAAYFKKYKISVLFPFSKDILWIGHANGIIALDKRTNRIDSSIRLAAHDVRTIYRARDQSIWIGTYGKGFFKYHNNKFIKMPLDKQQYLLFNHSFNEDRNGFFWIPTNNGLFQCKKADLDAYAAAPDTTVVYYFYHKGCGKYTNEFNGGSNPMSVFYKHLLLLPTINGVVSFAVDSIKPDLPNRNIIIESIKADDKEIKVNGQLLLSPAFKRLEFCVAAPYMGDPVNNVLEYNLNENESKWYPVYQDGKIVYNRLPPGTYQLNIRKRTGFGVHNYAYRHIVFTVVPFWYQTFWFILLVVLLSGALVYYMVRLRIAVLEKSKRVLEKMVGERTAALNETVDELHLSEQHLSSVNQIQEKAIAIILHDIQSPLNYLSTYARYFNRNLKKLSGPEIDEFAGSLAESASEINKFTNDLLQWLIFNQDDRTVLNERVHLPELLQEIRELYTNIAQFSSNVIHLEPGAPEYIFTDRNKLKLVIRNLVDNANKNSINGIITIATRLSELKDEVIMSIADTGRGMTDAEVQEMMNRKTGNNTSFKTGKLGFTLVLDCLELIGGRITIQSEKGVGTTMTIYLPA